MALSQKKESEKRDSLIRPLRKKLTRDELKRILKPGEFSILANRFIKVGENSWEPISGYVYLGGEKVVFSFEKSDVPFLEVNLELIPDEILELMPRRNKR